MTPIHDYENPAADGPSSFRAKGQWNDRSKAHLLAGLFFILGVTAGWLRTGEAFGLSEAACLVAIAWFPPVLVETLRRFRIERYGLAGALLSGIAGWDGIIRLFHTKIMEGC